MKRILSFFCVLFALMWPLVSYAQGGGGGGGGAGGGAGGFGGGDGGGGTDDGTSFILLILVLIVGMISAVAYFSRYRKAMLVNIVVILRHGQSYGQELDKIVGNADFSTLEGRVDAWYHLKVTITQDDILESYAVKLGDVELGKAPEIAKAHWEEQLRRTGITPRILNVSLPNHSTERYNRLPRSGAVALDDPSVCFLGIVTTVSQNANLPKNNQEIKPFLNGMLDGGSMPGEDAYFFYYTPKHPKTDAPLMLGDTPAMLESLKGNSLSAAQSG